MLCAKHIGLRLIPNALHVSEVNPLSKILGVRTVSLETACGRIHHEKATLEPDANHFLEWFWLPQQRDVGRGVNLLDKWIYQDTKSPGIESLPIKYPTCPFRPAILEMIGIDYSRYRILLGICGNCGTSTVVPFPAHFNSDCEFASWLEDLNVLLLILLCFLANVTSCSHLDVPLLARRHGHL